MHYLMEQFARQLNNCMSLIASQPGMHVKTNSCKFSPCAIQDCYSLVGIWIPKCLRHIVNLRIIDVMGHITKIAAVETTTAIWEYDSNLPGNRVLEGSLDVITAICTLAVKVSQLSMFLLIPLLFFQQIQCSGQCIKYFEKIQIECGITTPLVIPLYSNI